MLSHTSIIIICVIALVFLSDTVHMKCTKNVSNKTDSRPGRCPHPQYAVSSLPCSAEDSDTVCPSNYKCCPLARGLACFEPCPEWSTPCNLTCQFGLKVSPSPCTTCECAPDPCLTTTCNKGQICVVEEYKPCWKAGTCGYVGQCIRDPSVTTGGPIKPNNCPDYWPGMASRVPNYTECSGSDSECPGDQKCCQLPPPVRPGTYNLDVRYCVDPCVSKNRCRLSCEFGLQIVDGCIVCRCVVDPCRGYECPTGTICKALPAPCYRYRGSPPCPFLPVCI